MEESFFFSFSQFFFLNHKLGALRFLLILNKYIFTFVCYIHYVNQVKKEPKTLYQLTVVKKEGLLFPLNGCCIYKK